MILRNVEKIMEVYYWSAETVDGCS